MVGGILGSYRILAVLGEGGMGIVYVGEHAMLGNRVAIKLLRSELSRDAEMVNRFFNEARAAAMIRHPGIVQIFDFGVDPVTGSAYFVMELLDGETLSSRLRARSILPFDTVQHLVRQIAHTLVPA